MSKPQVRLDPDVAAALHRDAERKGDSLNVTANRWLRRALGLTPTGPEPAPPVVTTTPVPPQGKATITPATKASPTACPHPANRRLGPHCMQCGVTFPAAKPALRR